MDKINQPEKYKVCPIQLDDSVWLLGNYFFNLYLVKGARSSALIEMGVSGVVDAVIGQLDHLGVSPDYLVLTHPHSDHLTGLPGLRDRYPQARLVAGVGAREFALHPKALPGMIYEDRYTSLRLGQEGWAVGRPPLEQLVFPEDYRMVGDTTDLDLGGLTLRCSLVKGHSPGNIMVAVPEKAALFVSDSLGFHYPGRGFSPLFFTGFQAFRQTLDQIEALEPALLGPAHQGPLRGPEAPSAIRDARCEVDWVLDAVRRSRADDEGLARELYRKYYVDEFTLYSEKNILNCCRLLVRRAKEALAEA